MQFWVFAFEVISIFAQDFFNNIPDYKFLNYKPPVSSKVYSGDEIVADFLKKKNICPYESIPKYNKILLFAEDKNFFHTWVDAKGVLRAVINTIKNLMTSKRLEGASTITQQVAKNFLLRMK